MKEYQMNWKTVWNEYKFNSYFNIFKKTSEIEEAIQRPTRATSEQPAANVPKPETPTDKHLNCYYAAMFCDTFEEIYNIYKYIYINI